MSTDNFVAPVKRITNAFNYGIKLAERISKSASSAPAARALQILELVENLTNSLELASRATSEAYRQNVAACGQPFTKALVEDQSIQSKLNELRIDLINKVNEYQDFDEYEPDSFDAAVFANIQQQSQKCSSECISIFNGLRDQLLQAGLQSFKPGEEAQDGRAQLTSMSQREHTMRKPESPPSQQPSPAPTAPMQTRKPLLEIETTPAVTAESRRPWSDDSPLQNDMKPLQPNHKEPPKLQERHHQGVYRRRLISMIAFFLVGVLMCIGHHLYYTSLVGQVVGNVDDQQTALRYGTTFAYLAQVCLVTPVGFAYTQWLWKGLERKIVTVNALDAAFGARTSILSLLDAEILWKTRAGLILAFIVWCNLAPPLITPATLFVNPSLVPHYTMTAVPCFNISGPGQPERFAYSVPAKDSGANGLGANNLSGIFLGPRTIINRLSAATAAQGEILPIIPPFVNASYQLQFYGPTVDCQAANSSIAAIIDNKANELPALQGSVEFSNAYFAFVPYMSDSGYKAIPSNRLQQPTNGSNQLWMKFSAFVINSMGQQNPEPRYLVCQLYNASYNISLDFVEGHQTITNNSLLILNEVDYPQADLIAPSDLVQYAYSAVMWAFTDLLTGSMGFCNDKSPNSLSFAFSETNTPILDTSLLGTSDLDVIFDMCHALHSSSDSNTISGQRLHDIQLARNQTLDVLIPELAYNITLSFMSDSLLSPSITTNVTTQDSVNLYAYHSMKLLLSYGATIFFALIAIILAAFAYLDNGVSNDRSFSSILSSSRMPGLSEPFHAQLPLRLPLSPSLRFTRVEGGLSFNTASSRFTNTIEGESMAEGIFGRSSAGRKFKHDQLNILPARLLSAFRRIIRPSLAQGYIRITWTCGCGRAMYADVKELKIGAAKRLQSTLRKSAMVAVAAAGAGPTSGNHPSPTVPQSALLRPSNTQQGCNTSQRASNDAARAGISATPSTADIEDTTSTSVAQSSRDQIHLLLCIITSRSKYLAQLNVTTFTNDQYLFKSIVDEYQQIRMAEAWYCKIPKTNLFQIPRWFSSFIGDLHLFVPTAANFVKFRLVPCGTIFRPWGFTFQSLPPPEEVQVNRNWDYNPCPQDIDDMCLDEQLIHSLLEPDKPHLDRYWLDCFPKKLKGELRYEPGKVAIGWGIHIAEGPNWAVISWLALLIVVSSGIFAVLYSIFKNDASSAFTIAAWVVAIQGLMVTHLHLMN